MREGITLGAGDRSRLEAVVADRNSPQKHVWRARIVLLAARLLGATDLAGARAAAAPGATIQAVARSVVRRQAQRHRRALGFTENT